MQLQHKKLPDLPDDMYDVWLYCHKVERLRLGSYRMHASIQQALMQCTHPTCIGNPTEDAVPLRCGMHCVGHHAAVHKNQLPHLAGVLSSTASLEELVRADQVVTPWHGQRIGPHLIACPHALAVYTVHPTSAGQCPLLQILHACSCKQKSLLQGISQYL